MRVTKSDREVAADILNELADLIESDFDTYAERHAALQKHAREAADRSSDEVAAVVKVIVGASLALASTEPDGDQGVEALRAGAQRLLDWED